METIMEPSKIKKGKRNILFGLGCSTLVLLLGLIVPRVIVVYYGSEVNGLLSSTTQLLTYLALFEAGLSAVMCNALYSAIAINSRETISSVYVTGKQYYRKMSIYYGICLLFAAILFTFAIRSDINRWTIFGVVLLSGLNSVITFNLLSSVRNVIEADGNYYFVSILDVVGKVLNYGVTIFIAMFTLNIVTIKVSAICITLMVIGIYHIYFKRKYSWINKKAHPQFDYFKQRKFYIIHQIAGLLFSSTDITLLTFCANLVVVSIYTIYNLVISAIAVLMNTISSALVFALGQTFFADKERYCKLHDAFKLFYIEINFIIISICYFVFVPFVSLYMKGADVNYADNWVAFLFCLISLLNSTRMVDNCLASIAYHMKETLPHVITEALINLIVSLSLVWKLKIYGVLLGTITAILYRSIVAPLYTEKHILNRKIIYGYKYAIINWSLFACVCIVKLRFPLQIVSYWDLLQKVLVISIAVAIFYLFVNGITFREEYKRFWRVLLEKKEGI